ncbi:MAG: hypothetical protein J7K32_05335 [Deltaproteobacteria bacterium]|nr:hypothetical protein [Deltaproteobacteria bacterium]
MFGNCINTQSAFEFRHISLVEFFASLTAAIFYLRELKETGKFVNIIHDEFVFEVAQKDKDKTLTAVEKVMIAGMLKIFLEASTLNLVDAHAGDNWADAK